MVRRRHRDHSSGANGSSNVVDIYTIQTYPSISSTKTFTLVDNTTVTGQMQLRGGSLGLATFSLNVGSMSGNAPIDLGSQTLTVGNDNTSTTYSGIISDAGNLVKTGVGTLVLTGNNTYSGGTTVSQGTLQGNAASLQGSVVNNASVVFNQTVPGTYGGLMSGSGSLTKTGNDTLVLTGNNTYTGGTTVNGGELSIGTDSNIGGPTSPITFNGGILQVTGNALANLDSHSVNWSSFNGGFDISANNNTFAVSQVIGGTGSMAKYGGGTLILSGSNSYSGGTTVNAGTLRFGSASALGVGGLTVGPSGTVDLNGFSYAPSAFSGSSAAVITDNSLPTNPIIPTTLTLNVASGAWSYAGAIATGDNGQPIALIKGGYGTLTLSGSSNYSGGTNINEGTLNVNGGTLAGGGKVSISDGAILSGYGVVKGNINGFAGSTIQATGNLTLGDSTSYTGFNQAGTLAVGANTVTLNSAGFANLGVLTSLSGGTLSAPNGVSIGVGCNLVGSGAVNGKIAAGYGSTISATGNLTLGDATSPVGFTSDGELYTNANTVTLNSGNAANNKNAVVLGSLTKIDGGSLVAPNGILLDSGKNLVTTDAGGTVSGGTASRFLNRGNVQGPTSASGNWLIFNLLFKGSTGQTSGRIGFLGGFATGDSPGVNIQYGATLLGGSGTEFDIGGITPGNSDNNYGQLNIVTDPHDLNNHGDLALLAGTSLNIVDWNGFVPIPGETFTVLTWDGKLSGTASLAIDPAFASHGIQFVPQWNSNSLVIDATPEPSTFALLGAGAIALVGYGWRQYSRRVRMPGCGCGYLPSAPI
ncbi:MAG: autotransporter-associated beta strand repeat-containing protein [Thermoguttaceae bacterium]